MKKWILGFALTLAIVTMINPVWAMMGMIVILVSIIPFAIALLLIFAIIWMISWLRGNDAFEIY